MAAPESKDDEQVVLTRVWSLRTRGAGELSTRLVWLRGVMRECGEPELEFGVPPRVDTGRCRPVPGIWSAKVRVLEADAGLANLPAPPTVSERTTMRRVCHAGLWATLGDFVEIPGGGANVFGIHISSESMRLWNGTLRQTLFTHDSLSGLAYPIVTYHGGPASLHAHLSAPGGALQEDAPQGPGHAGDPPMMGRGVYTGSYWKARRFALWSGGYEPRSPPGVVVRTLAFVSADRVKVHDTPRSDDPADSEYIRRFFRSNPKRAAELSLWVDHEASWRAEHDAVYVPAAKCPLVRNDEWAFRAEVLAVADAASPLPAADYDASERGPATLIA